MHIKVVTKETFACPEVDIYTFYAHDLDKHVICAYSTSVSAIRGKTAISYSTMPPQLIITAEKPYDANLTRLKKNEYLRRFSYNPNKAFCNWIKRRKGYFRLGDVVVVVPARLYLLDIFVPEEASVYIDGKIIFDGGRYAYQSH